MVSNSEIGSFEYIPRGVSDLVTASILEISGVRVILENNSDSASVETSDLPPRRPIWIPWSVSA